MPFDAPMMSAVACELNGRVAGAKIEKIHQPEKDEAVFDLRFGGENLRLLISAGAACPRICLTASAPENPAAPPMFCMLLRKHLAGARVTGVRQLGYERAAEISFAARDDLGFECEKYLIAEIMGKYSNIIFCDKDRKIIGAAKTVDFTESRKRQVLPGMLYELPPPQDKRDPLEATEESFKNAYIEKNAANDPEKFLTGEYVGISPLVAREIVFNAAGTANAFGSADASGASGAGIDALWKAFSAVMELIRSKNFTPTLIEDAEGAPLEYCFMPVAQYGNAARVRTAESFSRLIDAYFGERDRTARIRQRCADILKLLANAETRLNKKTALQQADLKACAEKDKYKKSGDLITSNMYRFGRGAEYTAGVKCAALTDWSVQPPAEIEVALDQRLTPSQNAQRYYKKYNKAKTAETQLSKQIALSKAELDYIHTVFDALTKAETEADLAEIRRELYESGYASKMKNYQEKKAPPPKPMEFVTDGGFRLLCGKNNSQNDYVTTKAASKTDYWFHVKNVPGSHVVLFCDGREPSENDLTQAAAVAAYYSKASGGQNVAVDYTPVKNVKKPAGSKPGFVIYLTNRTAYVTPDGKLAERLRKTKR